MVLISELSYGSAKNPPDPNPYQIGPSNIPTEETDKPSTSGDAGGGQCPALMEVIKTDDGRWTVSRVVQEHSHGDVLSLTMGPTSELLPTTGMKFDSVLDAKAYYTAYSEKLGFSVELENGMRSPDMQRFVCEKGKSHEIEFVKKSRMNQIGLAVVNCDEDGNNREFRDMEKVPLVNNPGQSKLLRELGIRVSRYTHEERRDIILKYMQKRSNRQVINRTSTKIPSRQALAERRQRGVGGKFLSKEKTETLNKDEDEKEEKSTEQEDQETQLQELQQDEDEIEIELSQEELENADGVPLVGMVFESEEKSYEYYVNYAAKSGFSVRKGWCVKNAKNMLKTRTFVCSKEGFRPKRVRPETRTGCTARISIKETSDGKFRVSEFLSDHNHQLSNPLDIQLLKSQRGLTLTEVKVKPGFDRMIPEEYRNYLRVKRSNEILEGDSGALLDYFTRMKSENPNFYYGIQVDEFDRMSNFFWANSKNILDYQRFGDVLCFDTTFRVCKFGRPLVLFLGQNNFKQIVLFGAGFIYDESMDSFKWIFQTFKSCMGRKHPQTVLTDRCEIISQSVAATWQGSSHRFCTYQIYQNAIKEIGFAFQFGQCLFNITEEEEFVKTWESMLERENLKENEWLSKLFLERESWALPYNKQVFFADIETSLKDENFCNLFEDPLSPMKNVLKFFNLFDNFWGERNKNEEKLNFESNNKPTRVPLPTIRILWQAASLYTPIIFEDFMSEYKLFSDCIAYNCDEFGSLSEYIVRVKNMQKEYLVRFDSLNNSICCTCKKFEFMGILCCHVLKIFDLKEIKEMPEKYILDRWRKDFEKLEGMSENNVQESYLQLYRNFYRIAMKASENEEMFSLMVNQSEQWLEEVDRILQVGPLEKLNIGNGLNGNNDINNNNNNNNNFEGVKRKSELGFRRKNQNDFDVNKRQKIRKDLRPSEEVEIQGRGENDLNAPCSITNDNNQFLNHTHIMQGQFLIPNHFGMTATQALNNMTQFPQATTLPQQQFPSSSRLPQGYSSAEIQALQYIGTNQQNTDQGQGSIPVWDFL